MKQSQFSNGLLQFVLLTKNSCSKNWISLKKLGFSVSSQEELEMNAELLRREERQEYLGKNKRKKEQKS